MAKIVDISENTYNRIIRAVQKVEGDSNSRGESRTKLIKRGGKKLFYYFKLTASTNITTYTANRYDDIFASNLLETGLTIYANLHDAGTLPINTDYVFTAIKGTDDDEYYIHYYPIFFGA